MKRFFVLLWFSLASIGLYAQIPDTLRMMHYNLLYYTNNSGVSDCNSISNNLNNKDANLRTILNYVKPDVLCVCELGSQNEYADRILDNVLNTNGVNYFSRGPLTNLSGGYIANMIFYDSRKLQLYSSQTISTAYRDINGYTMFYKSENLANEDTVFVTFWLAHFKAGSGNTNENYRQTQAQRLMNRISQNGFPGNYILSGDLNLYSSNESAYKELTEYSNSLYRFYDPVNSPGNWHNNYQFSSLHTQSTHTSNDDCFSSGGLDDRFDFILVSPYLYYGSDRMHIVDNSYRTLGQDGNRMNGTVLSPTNNSVPSNVATALFNQSDHLPVIVDFTVDANVGVTEHTLNFFVNVVNPVQNNLEIVIQNEVADIYKFDLYTIDGRLVKSFSEQLENGVHSLSYNVNIKDGMYILMVSNKNGQKTVKKIVK